MAPAATEEGRRGRRKDPPRSRSTRRSRSAWRARAPRRGRGRLPSRSCASDWRRSPRRAISSARRAPPRPDRGSARPSAPAARAAARPRPGSSARTGAGRPAGTRSPGWRPPRGVRALRLAMRARSRSSISLQLRHLPGERLVLRGERGLVGGEQGQVEDLPLLVQRLVLLRLPRLALDGRRADAALPPSRRGRAWRFWRVASSLPCVSARCCL